MHPLAAWLALNGWEPYYTETGHYAFAGQTHSGDVAATLTIWPCPTKHGASYTKHGVRTNMSALFIKRMWRKLKWHEVRPMYLELAYDILKGE